ncbi:unnamed protein product, partial [marine sediment metagenome]
GYRRQLEILAPEDSLGDLPQISMPVLPDFHPGIRV